MAKINFVVNNKPSKAGKYAVLLRVTIVKDRAFMASGVELKNPNNFLSDGKNDSWVHSREQDYRKMNEKLKELKIEASKTYEWLAKLGVAVTPQMVVDKLKPSMGKDGSSATSTPGGAKEPSFMAYAKKKIADILKEGGYRNWKKYKNFLVKLQSFLKEERQRDLLFLDITPSVVSSFKTYLYTLHNDRHPDKILHTNYIQTLMKCFKALYRMAIEEKQIDDPISMKAFSVSHIDTQKEKLNVAEIRLLEALSLESGTLIWNCRNAFLFSFYCAGVRAGDLLQLRWCNITTDGRLHYQMGKNHKDRDLILVEQAKEILKHYQKPGAKPSDYIFPFMDQRKVYAAAASQAERDTLPPDQKKAMLNEMASKNTLLNKYLKKIAEMAGIEKKVSMHISRHSFASIASNEGYSPLVVQQAMAHSSIQVTQTYMGSFDTKKTDEAIQHISSSVDQPTHQGPETDKSKLLAMIEGMDAHQIASLLAAAQGKE